MADSSLLRDWDPMADRWSAHSLRWTWIVGLLLSPLLIAAFLAFVTTPLSLMANTVLGICLFVAGLLMNRLKGRMVSISLLAMAALVSTRYIYWRITSTLGYGDPSRTFSDLFFATGLMAAELYAFTVLIFGFFQALWPLQRAPEPLPVDHSTWPTLDIYIPTYNEPLTVVRPTILAATDLDWPEDKLRVYVLDDGRRQEFREYCESIGVTHITRPNNFHAKAGNINAALSKTSGEYIAIFDCDHIPTRSFLQIVMGWFIKDPKLALMQTPHHFFSPDPFERNLDTFRKVPNEGELFYGLLQDGNDLWNATFFCGSCAVIRRTALQEVGGIAVETVTEDAHTALKLHRRGWRSAYLNIAQAAGLATESLSAHVGQRIRWARGMAQIFRIDNPLFGPGLHWTQRACYFNAMLFFFFGLPRLVFLTAPLAFLYLGAHTINAWALLIASYALPHIAISLIINSRVQGRYRHSFWSEVYETVLAVYVLIPTTLAVINPKLGKFNVTAKGGKVDATHFDRSIARPYIFLVALNIFGILFGLYKLFFEPQVERATLIFNLLWTFFSLIVIGAALSCAWERKQTRNAVRVAINVKGLVRLRDGRILEAVTADLSETGAALRLSEMPAVPLKAEEIIELALIPERGCVWIQAAVVRTTQNLLMLRFVNMGVAEHRRIVFAIFGRADAWLDWSKERPRDRPLRSLGKVTIVGMRGISAVAKYYSAKFTGGLLSFTRRRSAARVASALAGVLLAASAALVPQPASAQYVPVAPTSGPVSSTAGLAQAGASSRLLTFEDLGMTAPVRMVGIRSTARLPLGIRDDEVVTGARVHLRYAHSPSLIYELSHFNIYINGELAATIPMTAATAGGAERDLVLDPKLFVGYNWIDIEAIAHYTMDCEEEFHTSAWSVVSNLSTIQIDTRPAVLPNNLATLPEPFFDEHDPHRLNLPFVFAGAPSNDELQAAGTVASWFAAKAAYRGARFPVYYDSLPPGNAVVIAEGGRWPAGLAPAAARAAGPHLTIVPNPSSSSPAAKLLVISGGDGPSLVQAAHGLVFGSFAANGADVTVREMKDPEDRKPYDAPRWIPTERSVRLGELLSDDSLQIRGTSSASSMSGAGLDTSASGLIQIPFHVPPDLFGYQNRGAKLDLKYRYSPMIGMKSGLTVGINNKFVEDIGLYKASNDAEKVKSVEFNMPFAAGREQVDERAVYLPDYDVASNDTLQLQFSFERKKTPGECRDVPLENLHGSISPESTLDLSKLYHYAYLPDLYLFADGGFPYTRMADLSETAIVMPQQLTPEAVQVYLDLLGLFGNSTGYPATRFKLAMAGEVDSLKGLDIVVIGSADGQPLLQKWSEKMPLNFTDTDVKLRVLGPIERLLARWDGRDLPETREAAGRVIMDSGRALGAIMGFESPVSSGRVVTMITAGSDASMVNMINQFTESGKKQFIRGDLVLLNGKEVSHFALGKAFIVGHLPVWVAAQLWLSHFSASLLILCLFVAIVISLFLYRRLRSQAQARKSARA